MDYIVVESANTLARPENVNQPTRSRPSRGNRSKQTNGRIDASSAKKEYVGYTIHVFHRLTRTPRSAPTSPRLRLDRFGTKVEDVVNSNDKDRYADILQTQL